MKIVADVVALASLHRNFNADVKFADAKQEEAANHLLNAAEALVAPSESFKWD